MNITNDKVAETKFLQDKSSPQYVSENGFFPYINDSNAASPVLRLKIQYFASDWLFIQSYLINVDGTQYTITPDSVEQDNGIINGESMIWEWYDYVPSADDVAMLKAIANSKSTIIRFIGQQYHADQTITAAQKQAITNVLIEYDALQNGIDASPAGIATAAIQKSVDGFNSAASQGAQGQFNYIVAHDYPNLLDTKLATQCAEGVSPATNKSWDLLNASESYTNSSDETASPYKGLLTWTYTFTPAAIKAETSLTLSGDGKNFSPDVQRFGNSSANFRGNFYSVKMTEQEKTYPGNKVWGKPVTNTEYYIINNGQAYMSASFC